MAQAEAAVPLTWREQSVVWLISGGHGVTHYMHTIVVVLSPILRVQFDLSYTQLGLFYTIYTSGNFIAAVVGGPLGDLTGRRQLLQVVSMIMLSLAVLLFGFIAEYVWLCTVAVLISFASQLWHPAAIPYLATRFNDHRGYVMSIHGMSSNLGDVLVTLVVPAMISGNYLIMQVAPMPWRDVVLINAIPGLLILPFLVVMAMKEKAVAAGGGSGLDLKTYFAGIRVQLKNRTVLGIGLIAGLRTTAQSGSRNFLPVYLVDQFQWSLTQAGIALLLLNLGGSFGAIPAGMASDKYGRRKVMMWAIALATVFILLLPFLQNELYIVFGICLVGFSIYATRPVLLSWMMDVVPGNFRGTATSLMFGAQSVFSVPNMVITGIIADTFGISTIFYYFAFMLLLANVVAFFLPKGE
jgi:MFS family permease